VNTSNTFEEGAEIFADGYARIFTQGANMLAPIPTVDQVTVSILPQDSETGPKVTVAVFGEGESAFVLIAPEPTTARRFAAALLNAADAAAEGRFIDCG
jgi:hypothetical protein